MIINSLEFLLNNAFAKHKSQGQKKKTDKSIKQKFIFIFSIQYFSSFDLKEKKIK